MTFGSTICGSGDASQRQIAMFDGYFEGRLSAHMTLMYWLKGDPDVDAIDAALKTVLQCDLSKSERTAVAALAKLLADNRAGCERIAAMLRSGMDTDAPASTVVAGLDFSKRLFDWSVAQCPEASVALYSLGNPWILAAATAEIAAQLAKMGLVTASCDALDVGCGTGRLELALAPVVRTITGIDLSPKMVAAAQLQCAHLANVQILQSTGRDLALFSDASFDLVFAVDSFPYIVQSGGDLAKAHFSEAYRALRQEGSFLIFEYSYRDDLKRDCADVVSLADSAGFAVRALGERPFSLWDGTMYHLVRK